MMSNQQITKSEAMDSIEYIFRCVEKNGHYNTPLVGKLVTNDYDENKIPSSKALECISWTNLIEVCKGL